MVSFRSVEHRKTPSACAGASLGLVVGAHPGARRQVEVARMGPCCKRRVGREVADITAQGAGPGATIVNARAVIAFGTLCR